MVGGGPVGLYAAIVAAQSGLGAVVVERRDGVIDKACGEGLMPTALSALTDVGVEPAGVCFRGIRYLDALGSRQVHARLSGGPGRGVRRTVLMEALQAEAARTGVAVVHDHVVDVTQDSTRTQVTLASGEHLSADAVLACDGLGSGVRRALGLEREASGRVRYGLRRHYHVQPWSDDVEVYWSRGGEAYVTPVADTLVGVALLGERGGSFDERLTDFPALVSRLGAAEPTGQVLGAGPLRRRTVDAARGRVLLVGDAAGYVDALTGEGLAIGFLGARAAVSSLVAGEPSHYAADWRRLTRRYRWSTEALLRATQLRGPRSALLPLASAAPTTFGRAVRAMT